MERDRTTERNIESKKERMKERLSRDGTAFCIQSAITACPEGCVTFTTCMYMHMYMYI